MKDPYKGCGGEGLMEYLYKDDIQFVTEFPCFWGHPDVLEVTPSRLRIYYLNCTEKY